MSDQIVGPLVVQSGENFYSQDLFENTGNVVDNLGIFFRMFDRLGFPLAVTLIFVISFCKQDEEHPFPPPKKHCGYRRG